MSELCQLAADLARDVGILRAFEVHNKNAGRRPEAQECATLAYNSVQSIRSGNMDRMKDARVANAELIG